MPVTGITDYFHSVAFNHDGRYIAGADLNHSLWIWDSRRQRLVAKWLGHTSGVWCVEFTPDGRGLISGGGDGMVKYWDMTSLGSGSERKSFPEIRRFSGHNVRLFVSPFDLNLTQTTGPCSFSQVLPWGQSVDCLQFRR